MKRVIMFLFLTLALIACAVVSQTSAQTTWLNNCPDGSWPPNVALGEALGSGLDYEAIGWYPRHTTDGYPACPPHLWPENQLSN